MYSQAITSIIFALINEVNGKSDVAEDGVCKDKFIETVNATDRLNKTWYVVYLKTLDKHTSVYPDGTPICGITSHGESCMATSVTFFNNTDFYVLGVNEELGEARVVHANFTRDSDKYAILKMQYKNSWIQERNGTSRLSELEEKDRDYFNSHFALIQIDINDRFAFIGRCPDFDLSFIIIDPKYYGNFLHSYFDFNVEEGTRAGRAFNALPLITDWIRFQSEFPDGYETLKLPKELLKSLSTNDTQSTPISEPAASGKDSEPTSNKDSEPATLSKETAGTSVKE